MAIFDRIKSYFGGEKPKAESSERKMTPEYSPETLKMVNEIDGRIEDSEYLLGALDKAAREQILTNDPEALQEIYAPKEMKMGLKGKYDAQAFESAGLGLDARVTIKRILTGFLSGSKYALPDKHSLGFVDKRKLKEEFKAKELKLQPGELKKAAKEYGLAPEEIKSEDFSKKYVEGKDGAEKIILKKKTEQEMNKTAGEILVRRIEELEKNGADLVGQKQGLARFEKELESTKDAFEAEDMEKFESEKRARNEKIDDEEQNLKAGLVVIRESLLYHKEFLDEVSERFAFLSKDVLAQEETFKAEIKGLQDKINKISRTQELNKSPVAIARTEQWQEQEAQAKANLEGFRKEKERLNLRITVLKINQAEIDGTLARINKIDKTPEELRAEKEKAKVEKNKPEASPAPKPAEQVKKESPRPRKGTGQPSELISGRFKPKGGMRGPDIQPRAEVAVATALKPAAEEDRVKEKERQAARAGREKQAVEPETLDDDSTDDVIAEQKAREEQINEIDRAANEPRRGVRAKVVPPTAEAAVPEPRPGEGKRVEKKETMAVEYWVDKLFGITLVNEAVEIMKKHFKLGREYDPSAPMTLKRAMNAYGGYLVEAKIVASAKAIETVKKHFVRKFKGDDKVIQEIEAVADAWIKAPKQAKISKNIPPVTGTPESKRPVEVEPAPVDLEQVMDESLVKPDAKKKPELGVKVPLIITRETKQQLADLGMSKKDMNKLRPEDAQKILNSDKPKAEIAAADAPKGKKEEEIDLSTAGLVEAMQANNGKQWTEGEAKNKEQIVFSNTEWLEMLDLQKVRGKKVKAVRQNFALPQMTLNEAVNAYMGYLREINGGGDTMKRENVEAVIKKNVEKYNKEK